MTTNSAPAQPQSIPVVKAADFDPAILQHHPVIIEDFVRAWPAFDCFDPNFETIERLYGSQVSDASSPQFSYSSSGLQVRLSDVSYAQYLAYLRQPEACTRIFAPEQWVIGSPEVLKSGNLALYFGDVRLLNGTDGMLPPLEAFFNSRLLPPSADSSVLNPHIPLFTTTSPLMNHHWLYAAIPPALTPLHIDTNAVHATLAQLHGTKHARFFAPADRDHYWNPRDGFADPDCVDYAKYPTFDAARVWEATLLPGQMLVFGSLWAHHVRTLTPSTTVSYDFLTWHNLRSFVRLGWWIQDIGERLYRTDFVEYRSLLLAFEPSLPPARLDSLCAAPAHSLLSPPASPSPEAYGAELLIGLHFLCDLVPLLLQYADENSEARRATLSALLRELELAREEGFFRAAESRFSTYGRLHF